MVHIALEAGSEESGELVEGDVRGFPEPHAELFAFHWAPGHLKAGVLGIPVGFDCFLESGVTFISESALCRSCCFCTRRLLYLYYWLWLWLWLWYAVTDGR